MYCPWCGAQNVDLSKFCRSCGAELATVAKVMTGELVGHAHHGRRSLPREALVQKAIRESFFAAGLLLAGLSVLLVMRASWGIWFVVGAFLMGGRAVAELVAAKSTRPGRLIPAPMTTADDAGRRNTGEILPVPPSVTEGTTTMMDPGCEGQK